MHASRTRFSKDVVTEFMAPVRPSSRVIIFCDGMPSVPSKKALLTHFAEQGFWTFHPRYRGTWESGGEFLKESPEKDIHDVIDGIHKPFTSIWDGVKHSFTPSEIWVFGASFGGSVALLSTEDVRVTGVVALSPVVDWIASEKGTEPINHLKGIVATAFGKGYRVAPGGWSRLKKGKLCNPIQRTSQVCGEKILLIHSEDDRIVPIGPSRKFVRTTHAEGRFYKRGGHLSLSELIEGRLAKRAEAFMTKVRKQRV